MSQTAPIIPLGIRHSLKTVGLNDTQITIFGELLLNGATDRDNLSRHTNINRTTVYKALKNLLGLGLVRKIRLNNKEEYEACELEEIIARLEDKRSMENEKFTETIKTLQNFWENLPKGKWRPKILAFEGIEGIKIMYEDTLKENPAKKIYTYGDLEKIYELLGTYTDEYIVKRVEKGVISEVIAPLSARYQKQFSKNKAELRKCIFVPKDQLNLPGEIRVYGNRVFLASFDKDQLVGFVMESEIIVKMFVDIFIHHRACITVLQKYHLMEEISKFLE